MSKSTVEKVLVVFEAFGDYRRGDIIGAAEKIKEILESEHVDKVRATRKGK